MRLQPQGLAYGRIWVSSLCYETSFNEDDGRNAREIILRQEEGRHREGRPPQTGELCLREVCHGGFELPLC